MSEYKITMYKNRDRHESNGIIYDYLLKPHLGFFDTDYNGKYYEWQAVLDGYVTNYQYNPSTEMLREEKTKINEIISWISLATLYEHSYKTKDTVYLYGFRIERHNGKSYRFTSELKNKKVYFTVELIEIYIGGQKW